MCYSMRLFLEKCVESYLALSGRSDASLRKVATPYPPEEPGSGPARAPMDRSVTCGCCGQVLPNASDDSTRQLGDGELSAPAGAGLSVPCHAQDALPLRACGSA